LEEKVPLLDAVFHDVEGVVEHPFLERFPSQSDVARIVLHQ
jgi:hypothetical protein